MKAVRVHRQGGPEVLTYEEVPDLKPGPGQAVIQQSAIGVNFMDIQSRRGAYNVDLPYTPGGEGAGTVAAVGEGVTNVKVGDVVVYTGVQNTYAEQAVGQADRLVKLPGGLDPKLAAAALLQGNTAYALVYSVYPIKPGDRCVIHAGAGGVGSLLIQMAKRLGAYVFTTVSSDEKAAFDKSTAAVRELVDAMARLAAPA